MNHTPAHGKNLFLTLLVLLLVVAAASWGKRLPHASIQTSLAAPNQQASNLSWSPASQTLEIAQGEKNRTVTTTLTNTGNQTETVTLTTSDNFPDNEAWDTTLNPNPSTALELEPGGSQEFTVFVSAPDTATTGDYTYRLTAQTTDGTQYEFLLAVQTTEATATNTPAPEESSVSLSTNDDEKDGAAGDTVKYRMTLRNTGTGTGRFRILIAQSCDDDIGGCDESLSITSVDLDEDQSREFDVSVILPDSANPDDIGRTTVRAELESDSTRAEEIILTTNVIEETEPTDTPTRTPTHTHTPTPLGRICQDIYEDDDHIDHASIIDVNVSQPRPDDLREDDDPDDRRAICPAGDEDWIEFRAVTGKVYTIDVPEMAKGIDLSLELYDDDGNSIAFNDDYYNRPDDDTDDGNYNPGPQDIRPRIDSWRAPADGRYYIRVRDNAGRGGVDRTYKIQVVTESYGPTPITINEECLDHYEPDGLPEQAALIVSNERQRRRTLCPMGDADWITFFGKTGKRYFIYTDTDPYRPDEDIVNDTEAGADTVLVLNDRDGTSMLDFNDDIFGGETLDSQIEFTPKVDGFYYVQIKNVGDIGNQFIRYDLILELCKPGQSDCGRASNPPTNVSNSEPAATPRPQPASNQGPTETPNIPDEEFSLDATSTPVPVSEQIAAEPTETLNDLAYSHALNFANPAFEREWQRTELSVASARVARSWIWGSAALTAVEEPYQESAHGVRQVQYFDKGRMEINDPTLDPSHPWYVTFGLLAQELVLGHVQVGNHTFQPRGPAELPVIGDAGKSNTPTYASFSGVVGVPAPDLTGEDALDSLSRDGSVGVYDGVRRPEARLVHFTPDSGHNIPLVFWRFLNAHGEVYQDGGYTIGPLVNWARVVGYPTSEPYWITAPIDGVSHDVLVQIYQRRVLFYIPDKPPGKQVEMNDIGRDYYQWRYGQSLP